MSEFYRALTSRRSIYALGDGLPSGKARVEEIVRTAMQHAPTAFDSRSARVLLLFGEEHAALWRVIVCDALKAVTPAERFPRTEQKIAGFAAAAGTVLYFEDSDVIASLRRENPLYAENFPVWSHQSSGMLQWIIWSAFALEGIGASLQHYNPLIDDAVRAHWSLPGNWSLVAEMPFGAPLAPAEAKELDDLEGKLVVKG